MNTTFLIAIASIGQLLPLPFAVIVAALGLPLGLTVVLSALRNAPEGHEDAEGFHWCAAGSSPSVGFTFIRPPTQRKSPRIALFPNYGT